MSNKINKCTLMCKFRFWACWLWQREMLQRLRELEDDWGTSCNTATVVGRNFNINLEYWTIRTTQPILSCNWLLKSCWYSNRVCSDLESLSRCVCIQIWQEWHWVRSLHFSLQHLWHCGSWWLWCRRVRLTTAFLLHYVGDSPDRVIHRSYIRGTLGTGILYN